MLNGPKTNEKQNERSQQLQKLSAAGVSLKQGFLDPCVLALNVFDVEKHVLTSKTFLKSTTNWRQKLFGHQKLLQRQRLVLGEKISNGHGPLPNGSKIPIAYKN